MVEHVTTRLPVDEVDIRDVPTTADTIEFRMVKRRYADSYVRCDVVGGRRSWFLENLLIEIAHAGPQGAAEAAARRGYRFEDGPSFQPSGRGLIEVSGRLVQSEVVVIPEPSDPR